MTQNTVKFTTKTRHGTAKYRNLPQHGKVLGKTKQNKASLSLLTQDILQFCDFILGFHVPVDHDKVFSGIRQSTRDPQQKVGRIK